MTEHADIVVIGAGASGLGFANWYRELHPNPSVDTARTTFMPRGIIACVAPSRRRIARQEKE